MSPRSVQIGTSTLLLVCVSLAACTSADAPSASAGAPSATRPAVLPQGDDAVDLNPADFTVNIDNEYWPMRPGTQWVYRETEGGDVFTVTVTVTTATKKIANGVTARVVRDTVMRGEEIVEDTFDWYAQDATGNVWYLGEDTAEFENGEVVSTEGSFEAGVDGALPGVIVPADPRPGLAYRQEYLKGKAEDNGEVLSVNEQVDVPTGHADHVLLTKDTITIEPDVLEYKLYAPGVGPVLTLGMSGGSGREELISVTQVPDGTGTGPLGQPNG
ncbi:MAG: hypothetical protein ABWY57_08330 [Mycetocola sp.]